MRKSLAWIGVVVVMLLVNQPATADIIFTENFESYAPGSNLVGQGGWIGGNGPGDVLTISTSPFLPSRVLNGQAATAAGRVNNAQHALVINPTAVTTLLYDSYATSSPITHSSGVFLGPFGSMGNPPGFNIGWEPVGFGRPVGWVLVTDTVRLLDVEGGRDRPVTLGIVIDGIAKEVYGLYDFGAGLLESPHLALTETELADITGIQIIFDDRSPGIYRSEILDNIRVSEVAPVAAPVPEPSTLILCGFGGLGLAILRWRRKRA